MFSISSAPERVILVKLINGDNLVCNLLLCKSDLPKGFLRRSKIIDINTEKEALLISNAVKHIEQINLGTGEVNYFMTTWKSRAISKVDTIQHDHIMGVSVPASEVITHYKNYLMSNLRARKDHPEQQKEENKEEAVVRFMTPGNSRIN